MLSICLIYLLLSSSALSDTTLFLEDVDISPLKRTDAGSDDGSTTTSSSTKSTTPTTIGSSTISTTTASTVSTTPTTSTTSASSTVSTTTVSTTSTIAQSSTVSTTSTTVTSTTSTTTASSTLSTTTLPPSQGIDVTQTSFTWSSKSRQSDTIEITVDEGLMIGVTISKLNLNGDNQDFLVIKSGSSLDDKTDSGRIFTYSIDNPVKYLFDSNRIFGYYYDAVVDDDASEFEIEFERFGEITTSTSTISTTTIDWPTTKAGDSTEITVNITGNSLEQFNDDKIIEDLKKCIAEMAKAYCNDNKINLSEEITETNVRIKEMKECPYNWPDSDKCVQTTFSLPIFYDNTIWSGYQMNTDNLERMWTKYAEQYLDENFEIYNAPNIGKITSWWAIAIICTVIIFIIIIIVVRCLSDKFKNTIRRRLSDTMTIVSSRKVSDVSLTPHYLQDTPKLFDNKYPLMDPEF